MKEKLINKWEKVHRELFEDYENMGGKYIKNPLVQQAWIGEMKIVREFIEDLKTLL